MTTGTLRTSSASTPATELIGVVRRVRCRWDDVTSLLDVDGGSTEAALGGYSCVGVKVDDEDNEIAAGVSYRFIGQWHQHQKHGRQFHADTFCVDIPINREGFVTYLADTCDNVGRRTAEQLWQQYRREAVQVLRDNPERVAADGLMTDDGAREASQCLRDDARLGNTKIELHGLFKGYGFPKKLIREAIEVWGARTPQVIRRDPFTLLVAGLTGCGFKRCDHLYCDLGLSPARLKRQMLGGWHGLRTDSNGHTWHMVSRFLQAVPGKGAAALKLGLRSKWIAQRTDAAGQLWVTEDRKAGNELAVAASVLRLLAWRPAVGDQSNTLWPSAASLQGLSDHQREKYAAATRRPLAILAGTPGTGKTYTAAAVIKLLIDQHGADAIAVCAPTGKAAVRCKEALSRCGVNLDTSTIHRLLGMQQAGRGEWGFAFNGENPLPHRFIVVDETSMLDTDLAGSLLSACRTGTHVLLIGDPYQLPPVGHGAPLRDLLDAGEAIVPRGELTEIRRNAGLIVHACASIKDGRPFTTCTKYDPDAEVPQNLRLIPTESPEESTDVLLQVLRRLAASGKFHPIWDCQVLVALNQKSLVSRRALNPVLQGELNADGARAEGNPFRVGDKIINLKNAETTAVEFLGCEVLDGSDRADPIRYSEVKDPSTGKKTTHYIANGDLGRVLAVAPKLTIAQFDGPRRVAKIPMGAPAEPAASQEEEAGGTGCDFDLGYALTTHKMQGSEAPVVIVMIDEVGGARNVCSREWVYTAISRAAKLCILIGRRGVLDGHCKRVSLLRRKTFLKELLAEK